MKEYPEANYYVRTSAAEGSIDPRIGEYLSNSYTVTVNGVVEVAVIPWLAESPWPPPFPVTFDRFSDRNEAAMYVLATTQIVIAPHESMSVKRDQVIFEEMPEMPHNAIWVPRTTYDALVHDLEVTLGIRSDDGAFRLDDLGTRPIAALLRSELPRANCTWIA